MPELLANTASNPITNPTAVVTDASERSPATSPLALKTREIPKLATTSFSPLPQPHSWRASKYRAGTTAKRRRLYPSHLEKIRLWIILAASIAICICLWTASSKEYLLDYVLLSQAHQGPDSLQILQPSSSTSHNKMTGPEKWLRAHSNVKKTTTISKLFSPRPRAAIISLVRNEELEGILQSMRELEAHWNHQYKYPWIFFNEQPFSDKFKVATSKVASAATYYEVVPRAHWSTPDWIDEEKYMNSLDYLGTIGVGKGWMLSYRNMCRWNSGFFYKHPALANYDYYWRVEPDVHFFCDIPYDPFDFLRNNNLIYGFNMNILDDARSFASLWRTTRAFMAAHPHLIHPDADLDWLLDPTNGAEYNNCQFFSNFEIGDLNFFRGEANTAYFDFLDKSGGFYYERFGDAPVHTLSVAMFAPKDRVWFFRDIGYQHDIAVHCPADGVRSGRCDCGFEPDENIESDEQSESSHKQRDVTLKQRGVFRDEIAKANPKLQQMSPRKPTSLDANFYKLVPMESPQRKPPDTCIRLWLGGEWLEKKEGWTQEAERAFGGDGYGGYVREGP